MIRRNIRRAIQAGRPPQPGRTIDASDLPRRAASASLGIGASPEATLSRLALDLGPRTLLVIDRRDQGAPGPRTTHAVATALGRRSVVTLGISQYLTDPEMRRWHALAQAAGATVSNLGTAGWDRVVFGDGTLVLELADVPAELSADSPVIALSAPAGAGALGLWTGIVHPNTALRARVAPNAVVELSVAFDARYLIVGQVGSVWIAGLAARPIVAELLARGIERMREQLQGYETPGPWEDAGVQHLSGIEREGITATDLVLRVRLEDNASGGLVRRLSEMLGARIEIVDDQLGGVGGER